MAGAAKRRDELRELVRAKEEELKGVESECAISSAETLRLVADLEEMQRSRAVQEERLAVMHADCENVRAQLEEQTWTQMSLENETAIVSERLDVVKQRLESARMAIGNPVDVESKLRGVRGKLDACVRERAAQENARAQLECKLCDVHEKLHHMAAGSSRLSRQLLREKERLLRVLRAKTSVVPLLLEQAEEIAFLRERLVLESRARSSLELMLEVELTDMQRRVLFESVARDELSVTVNHVSQLQGVLLSEVELLHSKLALLLERAAASGSDAAVTPGAQEQELSDMVALAEVLESKIRGAAEVSGAARTTNISTVVEEKQRDVEGLRKALDEERQERLRLQERCGSLESALERMEQQVQEDRAARERYEQEMGSQLAAMRDLHELLSSPGAERSR